MPGFEAVAPLFTELLTRLEEDTANETPEWTAAYHAVRQAMALVTPEGEHVAEFLLYVDGDRAWWQWSDEPFAD